MSKESEKTKDTGTESSLRQLQQLDFTKSEKGTRQLMHAVHYGGTSPSGVLSGMRRGWLGSEKIQVWHSVTEKLKSNQT